MSEFRYFHAIFDGMHPLRESTYRFTPDHSIRLEQVRHQPAKSVPKPRRVKQRRLRCDCGKLSVTVIEVRVGSDPQYTVHLPLCSACLALEQSFRIGD